MWYGKGFQRQLCRPRKRSGTKCRLTATVLQQIRLVSVSSVHVLQTPSEKDAERAPAPPGPLHQPTEPVSRGFNERNGRFLLSSLSQKEPNKL